MKLCLHQMTLEEGNAMLVKENAALKEEIELLLQQPTKRASLVEDIGVQIIAVNKHSSPE